MTALICTVALLAVFCAAVFLCLCVNASRQLDDALARLLPLPLDDDCDQPDMSEFEQQFSDRDSA